MQETRSDPNRDPKRAFSYREVFQWVVVVVLLTSSSLLGYFWVNREYQHHRETLHRVHDDYVALRKAEVRTIINQLVDEIEFHKVEVQERLKENITEQVRMAFDIAKVIYESERGRRSEADIKKLIIETLMEMRFFGGRGYYWIHDTNNLLIAHPFRQSTLGEDDSQTIDKNGQPFTQNFIKVALSNPEGGFVSYFWIKPETDEQYHKELGKEKIAYVRLFEPYGWVIGAGEYVDDITAQTQQTEIRRIASIRYGEAGYIFNHTREGICLNHVNEDNIGRNRWELLDAGGMKVVQGLDHVGRQPGGGFLEYVASTDPRTGQPAKKLSFIRSVDDWGWVLGGGVYLEDIESRLADLHADKVHRLWIKIATTMLALGVIVGLVLLLIHRLLGWFSRELNFFFAGKAAGEIEPVDVNRFRIAELREIAVKSNEILAQKAHTQALLLQAQKMESVGILAGGIAHDFNNLLQVMGGHIGRLLQGKPADHPDAARLTTVARCMDRAAQLVRQLLLFGRKAESSKVDVDLNHEVGEVLRILERTIPKMVALESHLESSLWPLSADPVQIEQVLLNLANNAVDAMQDGGKLVIETNNVIVSDDFAGTHPGAVAGRHVLLTVSDTGCGMDKKVLQHMYDPFFTTKEMGTGLGLATVYGIIKAHEGYLLCSSEPGQGTTFRIYLPAAERVAEPGSEKQSGIMPRGAGETILVVDDEPEIRELTRETLESLGYIVNNAASGEEALGIFQEHGQDIELVLLDLNMPGMGGYRCLQELLQLNPSARVLVVSGYTANCRDKDIVTSGAKGFLAKPYQLGELAVKVRQMLDHPA
jgi:signal transduction histidine kinase/ActR/RegA family two-component response regulator